MKDLICYCFEYSVDDINQDYLENGKSTIMEKIQIEKKFGNCQCATKNPKGKGCLGDVRQVVDKLKGKSSFGLINGNVDGLKVFGMRNDDQSTNIIKLENSLETIKERFNTDHEKIRFLALLSPTCPLGRDKGARAVHENVIKKYPDADVSASIVWIPILEKDTFAAAIPSVKFLSDKRIQHFYDNSRMVGKNIADSVEWTGNVAWDIYLFYRPFVEWVGTPPKPIFWMHQLTDGWATKEKYRTVWRFKKGALNLNGKIGKMNAIELFRSISYFILAGLCEIGGGYLVWLWLREGKPIAFAVVGGCILFLYGVIPTLQPAHFGRVYAAYGGVFIILSILWGWKVDKIAPDRFDVIGGMVALLGVAIIMYWPRNYS